MRILSKNNDFEGEENKKKKHVKKNEGYKIRVSSYYLKHSVFILLT